jgi:hypothetical protein
MQEQMEMAFMQEGGMKDDGMNRDPVSGNEIPPGSMAKEVRDDIPAMLSEGEYVVPADVVQYFGVKFFEDLRMAAKMGLRDMEVMQMNSGGVIGMADGGTSASNTAGLKDQDLRDYTLAPTVSSYLTPGALQFQAKAPPKVDMGEPECPEGYVFDKTKNACVPVEPAVTQDTREPRDPVSPHLETKPWYEGITSSAEDSVNRYFGTGAKIGAGVAGFIASASPLGLIGGIAAPYGVQGSNLAKARAEIALRMAAGDTKGAEMIQKSIAQAIKNSPGLGKADEFFENTFNASGEKNVISALESLGIDVPSSIKSKDFRKDPNFDPELMDFIKGHGNKIRTDIFKMEAKPTPSVTSKNQSSGGDDDHGKAHRAFVEKTKKAGETARDSYNKYQKETATKPKTAETKAAEKRTESVISDMQRGVQRGFNKGGLMKKKKK